MNRKPIITTAALFLLGLSLIFFGSVLWPPEGQALGSHDIRGLFYPWLEQVRISFLSGSLPWWDSLRFSGYPFLSNPQVAIFYPPTWLAVLLPTRIGISFYLVLHLWLAGLGVFLLAADWLGNSGEWGTGNGERWGGPFFQRVQSGLRELALTYPGPLLAAVTFMFGGFFTARLYAGHMGLIAVHAWVPWLLWGSRRALVDRGWRSALPAGLFLGLAVLAGHTTSLLYVGLIWSLFVLYLLIVERPPLRQAVPQGLLILLTAFVISAGQLLPLLEFSRLAARTAQTTFEFATDFSFPPGHLITLLVPEYFGEPLRAGYWSVPNFEELTAYIGLLPWLGLILALSRPRRQTWLLVALGGLGLLLAFGRYGFLYRILYDWVPPFRLARAPGRAMFMTALAGSLLLADGLGRLRQQREAPRWWPWVLLGGLLAGLAATAATGAVFAVQHPTETSGRLWHQLGGWTWATALFMSGGLLLRQWLGDGRSRWVWGLVALVLIDLWTFGYKFRQLNDMTPDSFWFEAGIALQDQPQPVERILPWGIPIFSQNGAGQAGLESVFGYNALEIGAYSALVGSVPDPRASSFDLLGATHVVATVPLDQFTDGDRPLTLVGQQGQAWVYSRAQAYPLARLVGRAEVLAETAAAVTRVHQPDFDAGAAAIVDQPVECSSDDPLQGTVEIISRQPGFWELAVESDRPALLVLAETAYPGWRASIDGQPAAWVTAYGALRALCVPAGTHEVSWTFVPNSSRWGFGVSLVGWLVLGAALLTRRRTAGKLESGANG